VLYHSAMSTTQFKCPACRKLYRAFVDDSTILRCHCGKQIKPNPNGSAVIVVETTTTRAVEQVSNTTSKTTTPVKPQRDYSTVVEIIFFAFVALLIVSGIGYYFETAASKKEAGVVQNPQTTTYPITTSIPNNQSSTSETKAIPNKIAQEKSIVYVHIRNTFIGSDKSVKSEAHLDEQTKTLSLKNVERPSSEIRILAASGSVVTIQFYENGVMEATKDFNRRSDLETGNGALIYTSRTGEITLSLSY
jgi:hypothetical protein